MKSRLSIFILLLLMLGMVGQAHATTISAVPDSLPKGAYADGPLNGDNNYFWQMVVVTPGAGHASGVNFVLTLPTGMTVADTDGDAAYADEISAVFTATNATMTLTPTATSSAITMTIGVAAMTAGDPIRIMFPVAVDVAPAANTDDYFIT